MSPEKGKKYIRVWLYKDLQGEIHEERVEVECVDIDLFDKSSVVRYLLESEGVVTFREPDGYVYETLLCYFPVMVGHANFFYHTQKRADPLKFTEFVIYKIPEDA